MRMKILCTVLALSVNLFCMAQKKLMIYNYSAYEIKIYDIRTQPSSGSFPYCIGYSIGLLPGQECVLENSASAVKFPFFSTATPPTIISNPNWRRYTTSSAFTTFTGQNLWNTSTSNTQSFNSIRYSVGSPSAAGQGIRTIGVSTNSSFTFAPDNWTVEYERIFTTQTNYEDIIVFF